MEGSAAWGAAADAGIFAQQEQHDGKEQAPGEAMQTAATAVVGAEAPEVITPQTLPQTVQEPNEEHPSNAIASATNDAGEAPVQQQQPMEEQPGSNNVRAAAAVPATTTADAAGSSTQQMQGQPGSDNISAPATASAVAAPCQAGPPTQQEQLVEEQQGCSRAAEARENSGSCTAQLEQQTQEQPVTDNINAPAAAPKIAPPSEAKPPTQQQQQTPEQPITDRLLLRLLL